MYNDEGVDREFHSSECLVWYDEDCNCFVRSMDDYMMDKYNDEYDNWEDDNPPRRSKTERPRHTTDNKGIFIVARKMASRFIRKGKK